MIKVKTMKDIQKLKHNKFLSKEYKAEVIKYFFQLHLALGNNIPILEFNLFQHGYIVILTPDDDVSNLESIGLSEGLIYSCPEYIDRIKLSNTSVYKINIMYENDYMMTIYSQVGIHDKEVEEWLAEEAEDSENVDFTSNNEVPF